MSGPECKDWRGIVAGVSRSFALSLRWLPPPMRGPASLAYLLARASDTLADTSAAAAGRRIEWLDRFAAEIADPGVRRPGTPWVAAAHALADAGHPHAAELRLLERLDPCLDRLDALPPAVAAAVRAVVGTIVSGQRLDLVRFAAASAARPVVLTEPELDDYTFRVAGCVGRFWTELAVLTLAEPFGQCPLPPLAELATTYGQGLQLVNILRDLPADLGTGRCYLPVDDPGDRRQLMAAHMAWLARARSKVAAGFDYSAALRGRRMRMASVLPALLGAETLDLLDGIAWQDLEARPKLPRRQVRALLWRALWWRCPTEHPAG